MSVQGDATFVKNALGRRIYFSANDQRGSALRDSQGDFNPHSLDLWRHALGLSDWDVVVDVGVNYGEMLLSCALPTEAKIVGFEPNPEVRQYLLRSLQDASLTVDLRECALSDKPGRAEFVVDQVWSGTSGLVDGHRSQLGRNTQILQVDVSTLDVEMAEFEESRSVCVKVDVEGNELSVLAGAAEFRERRKRWAMMLEVLHLTAWEIAELAQSHRVLMLDTSRDELLLLPPATEGPVKRLIESGWVYRQDLLVVSDQVFDEMPKRMG